MYSALPIHSLAIEASAGDYQGSLDGTNLPGDACLVLSTDPKPRLRWTTELHERFVDAVTQLGGPDSESPFPYIHVFGCFHSHKDITKFLDYEDPEFPIPFTYVCMYAVM